MRWYSPSETRAPSQPTLLWLHGGGFFRGSPDLPEAHSVAEALATKGVTVATAGYRLAPPPSMPWFMARTGGQRGRFPLALEDVLSAYDEVESRSPGGVILGGASAGACLAAGAIMRALDEGERPAGAIFAYGFFHARHPQTRIGEQRSRGHRRITHATWALDLANLNYAGSRRMLANRLAFPGGHDLRGFPRTLIVNAEHDNMRASGDLFGAELRGSGVDVEQHVMPGSDHAFLNRPELRAFSRTIALMAQWIRSTPAER